MRGKEEWENRRGGEIKRVRKAGGEVEGRRPTS